jgi:hypothetical protein
MHVYKYKPGDRFKTSRGRLFTTETLVGGRIVLRMSVAGTMMVAATFNGVSELERAVAGARVVPHPERVGTWRRPSTASERHPWMFREFVAAVMHSVRDEPDPEVIELDDTDVVLDGGGRFSDSRRREIVDAAIAGKAKYGSVAHWYDVRGKHLGASKSTIYRWLRERKARPRLRVLDGGLSG